MHIETERKFLVRSEDFRRFVTAEHHIRQGYIAHDGGNTVRIRIQDARGILTIKGPTNGMSRFEWEKEIPLEDAEDLMRLARTGRIEKTRCIVPAQTPDQVGGDGSVAGDDGAVDGRDGAVCAGDASHHSRPDRESSARFWEVDVFHGDNEGLIMAEIELGSEDEAFERPDWLGEEVTGDRRYYNSYLSKFPYKTW